MVPLPTFDMPTFPFKSSLSLAGIAGLLGGDDAVSAMTTVPVYEYRRWLGWYNSPGCFQLAKRLNSLETSLPSNALSIGIHVSLTALLEQDRGKSPKFRGAQSGTKLEETGYLATLFMKECAARDSEVHVKGRQTKPIEITIADLRDLAPEGEIPLARSTSFLAASPPVIVSILAVVLCAVWGDLVAALLILLGVIASGVSAFLLGCAKFVFTHPPPANGCPAGDGLLRLDSADVLLRGKEGAVNSITRGSFSLCFASQAHYDRIRIYSRLFLFQGIIQLFLIPYASPLGQFAFLASMGVSALYNTWFSSFDKEEIHRKMLFEQVLQNPRLVKYTLGTYTTAVVFMLLILNLEDPNDLIKELLPNDTEVWRKWNVTVVQGLRDLYDRSKGVHRGSPPLGFEPQVMKLLKPLREEGRRLHGSESQDKDKELLTSLLEDALSAYKGYEDYLLRK